MGSRSLSSCKLTQTPIIQYTKQNSIFHIYQLYINFQHQSKWWPMTVILSCMQILPRSISSAHGDVSSTATQQLQLDSILPVLESALHSSETARLSDYSLEDVRWALSVRTCSKFLLLTLQLSFISCWQFFAEFIQLNSRPKWTWLQDWLGQQSSDGKVYLKVRIEYRINAELSDTNWQ